MERRLSRHGRAGLLGAHRALVAGVIGVLASGCAAPGDLEPPRPDRTLVSADAWEIDPNDPFPQHQPDAIDCPPNARQPETGALEVSTGVCNYAALVQPLRADLVYDDALVIEAFHDDLAAEEPAEAHIAVAVADQVVWDETIPIPSAATPYRITVWPEIDAPAGTPIRFHLHNHGYNTWKILTVDAVELPPE